MLLIYLEPALKISQKVFLSQISMEVGRNSTRILSVETGEVLVIVEYCRFGNLQTYLINHRNSFINQVDELGNLTNDGEEGQFNNIIR